MGLATTGEWVIRPALPADIPVIRALADRIWRVSYAELLSVGQIDYMLGWMYAPDELARQMVAGVEWYLASLAESPVGFLSLTPEAGQGSMELNRLYLLPELHGKGWGQKLLDFALERSRLLGFQQVHLRVNRGNAKAIAAYTRAGYRVVRSIVQDIGGGYVIDDYVMAREVPGSEQSV